MSSISFEIEGNIPSKKNCKRILKNHKTGQSFIGSSAQFKRWEKRELQIMTLRKNTFGIKEPIQKTMSVTLTFYYKDKRCRDLTNGAEGVMDLLVKSGVIKDDNWIVCPIVKLYGLLNEERKSTCIVEIIY